jgi:hypothetical protein
MTGAPPGNAAPTPWSTCPNRSYDTAPSPTPVGLRPQLSYVLPADWAARQHAQADCTACGPRCPDHRPVTFTDTVTTALPGHGGHPRRAACATAAWTGPQTRSRIEALLCDARITKVLLDDVGQVTGFQPLRDSITPAQRRALVHGT